MGTDFSRHFFVFFSNSSIFFQVVVDMKQGQFFIRKFFQLFPQPGTQWTARDSVNSQGLSEQPGTQWTARHSVNSQALSEQPGTEWTARDWVNSQALSEQPGTEWTARDWVNSQGLSEQPGTQWTARDSVNSQGLSEQPGTQWTARHSVNSQALSEQPGTEWTARHWVNSQGLSEQPGTLRREIRTRESPSVETVASRMGEKRIEYKTVSKICPLRLAIETRLFQRRHRFNSETLLCVGKGFGKEHYARAKNVSEELQISF